MNLKSLILALVALIAVSVSSEDVFAQAKPKAVPTAESVKALLVANKNGGAALTQSLIEAIKANPELVKTIIEASRNASPQLLAAISAAIAQAVVQIAQTDPAAAAEIKKLVEAQAPEVLKQQVAANLAEATSATASTGATGGAGALGDVGVPLAPTTPSSSVSAI